MEESTNAAKMVKISVNARHLQRSLRDCVRVDLGGAYKLEEEHKVFPNILESGGGLRGD